MIDFVEILQGVDPRAATVAIAAMPVAELRGAIPIALGVYKMPIFRAVFWAVLGNMLPIPFLLWFWKKASRLLMERSKAFRRFFDWLFKRTRKKAVKKFMKYGQWFLILFVAVPLPITGAWTGSVAAFLFDVPYKKSLGLIFAGVLIAACVVALISTGAISFLQFLVSHS